MLNRWTIFGVLALLAVMLVASFAVVLRIDLAPEPEKGKPVVRTRNFGEGLKLSRKGLYGIDLVSIGKAHMRKLRKGPFTIGALNELVLEDVSLALPEELWKADAKPVDAFVSNASERKKASTGDAIETIASTNSCNSCNPWLNFSPAAQSVLAAGRELWRYYHAQPDANPNASYYDIRAHFQGRKPNGTMNATSADAKYNALLDALKSAMKVLARQIEPKVYEYGFLRK